jgi:8-oxo-dGTP diphosphatase
MQTKPVEVAIAILLYQDQFLLQLRDDIPGIAYPGCWGLFGGHLEPQETPIVALKRELLEEICYKCNNAQFFQSYRDKQVTRHVFWTSLDVPPAQLVLQEGWDLGLLTLEQIQGGVGYSPKAKQTRPIGKPHQKILLDFWKARTMKLPVHLNWVRGKGRWQKEK